MVTAIVKEDAGKGIAELIAERAERGWDLHLARRQLITKVSEDTYTVPASRPSQKTYTVHYGGETEDCTCIDFQMNSLACKHLVAVALLYVRRRRVRSKCEVCGVTSKEKALVGIRNDHRRHGPRYCPTHHPESMGQTFLSVGNVALDRLFSAKEREAAILGEVVKATSSETRSWISTTQ